MLPTVQYRRQDGEIISDILEAFFYELIYAPLLEVVNKEIPGGIKLNAASDSPETRLMMKLQNGDIVYDGEFFTGTFDARSSRQIREMGGEWDRLRKAFKLSPGKLTPNIKVAISASRDRLQKINAGMKNVLGDIEAKIDPAIEKLDLSEGIDKVIAGLQAQTINALKAIGVQYTLTHKQKETIKKDYSNNMKLYIKGWAEEHIKTLRKDVEANALDGYRFSRLQSTLEHRYGTSKSKAEFLAQQETSLFMAKFRQQRFLDAGVNFYVWQTVGDGKVREDHKKLNGRIFQFGDPPQVAAPTKKSPARFAEPGEDFRCRCIARPVTKPVHKVGGEWKIID